jgi:hypothetical protein
MSCSSQSPLARRSGSRAGGRRCRAPSRRGAASPAARSGCARPCPRRPAWCTRPACRAALDLDQAQPAGAEGVELSVAQSLGLPAAMQDRRGRCKQVQQVSRQAGAVDTAGQHARHNRSSPHGRARRRYRQADPCRGAASRECIAPAHPCVRHDHHFARTSPPARPLRRSSKVCPSSEASALSLPKRVDSARLQGRTPRIPRRPHCIGGEILRPVLERAHHRIGA